MKTYAQRLTAVSSFVAFCAVISIFPVTGIAQEEASTAPVSSVDQEALHDELRALRDAMLDAWQKRDLDAVLSHVSPNVVVTWQNAETSRGHAGIRKFYEEVMGGEEPLITEIESKLEVDELSILYGGDTAIALGSIHDDMTLNQKIARAPFLGEGRISLDSRWTATLIKVDGQWKLAGYHVSMDAFSNPIMNKAMEIAEKLAIVAGLAGLILGVLLAWFIGRKRPGKS